MKFMSIDLYKSTYAIETISLLISVNGVKLTNYERESIAEGSN